ncbi:MAG: hypothetical protein PVG60_01850 [Desulfarculaceae bacterium]|jgi:hypothetical protein
MSEQAKQMDLFGPRLDVLPRLKAAMSHALKESGLSREQVLDLINEAAASEGLKNRITVPTLEKWLAPSDTSHVISLRLLPLFCRVVGSATPLAVLAAPLGYALAGPREQRLIDLGKAYLQAKNARKQKRRAEQALEEMPI